MGDRSYLACGNIMFDEVEQDNGTLSAVQPGGPALFALAGIRTFTAECRLVSQVGRDHAADCIHWLEENGLAAESLRVASQYSNLHLIHHQPDGTYTWRSRYGMQQLGYLKTTPEHIDAASGKETRGIYLAQNTDPVFWEALYAVKKEKGFQIMWELEVPRPEDGVREDKLQRVQRVLPYVDMWSLNATEASVLFDLPRTDEAGLICRLQALPVRWTFFRVGAKGAYLLTPQESYFCPAVAAEHFVDSLGCGNCSTGAMLYGLSSGCRPERALAMANAAAAMNTEQYGPVPQFTAAVMARACALTDQAEKTVRIV
ncbi:MAG: carbohydrate kinase family protein [Subdoligranulum sp.]|nr:carbohydrate kinase family protein [Subdoligranulum sp.]